MWFPAGLTGRDCRGALGRTSRRWEPGLKGVEARLRGVEMSFGRGGWVTAEWDICWAWMLRSETPFERTRPGGPALPRSKLGERALLG